MNLKKTKKRLIVIPLIIIASIAVLMLLVVLLTLIVIPMIVGGNMTTIYRSPEAETSLMEIYDDKLKQWPEPYESVFVDTSYGKVHTIISGPEDAPPLLLLHASAMSASSWVYNMEFLNQHYRTYAIDNIGEAGRSALDDRTMFPGDGESLCDLYVEITDELGVDKAYIVGASNGGFIATNYALYAPERVKKLALLGPMGYSSTTDMASLRIAMVSMIPFKPLQNTTVTWALGDSPVVLDTTEEWFREVMSGTFPSVARPVRFTSEQLQSIEIPVLLVLGDEDRLLGKPEKASSLARNIPDIRIDVVDSGHLISLEQVDLVNELLYEFFKE
jgi:pimeloyl-ACP methyl ester carboxylesterase